MEAAIACLGKPPIGKVDKHYAYVALSRVQSLDRLAIIGPIDERWFRMPKNKDHLAEEKRLKEIDNATKEWVKKCELKYD